MQVGWAGLMMGGACLQVSPAETRRYFRSYPAGTEAGDP